MIIWNDIEYPELYEDRRKEARNYDSESVRPAVYKITESLAELTDEPLPEFYRGRTEKAVIVKDLLRRELHRRGMNMSRIGKLEALWTGSVTNHSTVRHSIQKDIRPLYGKYKWFYRSAKEKIKNI